MCEALLSERESFAVHPGEKQHLRVVNSPYHSATIMGDILRQLDQACRERSLDWPLKAILRACPSTGLAC
jgi:hypothetical protein